MGEVRLEIPARVEYLGLARQVVAAAAAIEPRFLDERIDDLRIAVSEATTNAIEAHLEHGDQGADERISIRCNLDDEQIEVAVFDSAGGFDPDVVEGPPEPTATDRLDWERGLGLPLMRELADETEIESDSAGTTVRLVVYTPHQGPEAGSEY
jgi:anti-sigma regulatory factor (Ser/Thr protein kinase)